MQSVKADKGVLGVFTAFLEAVSLGVEYPSFEDKVFGAELSYIVATSYCEAYKGLIEQYRTYLFVIDRVQWLGQWS